MRLNHQALYSALFAIMNEHGQVLFWSYTKTKSYTELAQALQELKERYTTLDAEDRLPRYWYVDNPSEVTNFLKEVSPTTRL